MHESAENMRAVWCLSSSDREGLVQHHGFGLPKLVAFQVRLRECTGLNFLHLQSLW